MTPRPSPMLLSSGVSALAQFGPTACTVAAVFLWGTSDFAGGYGSRRANAFVLTAFSHICAFALMFSVALAQHGEFPVRASILWAIAAGALGGFSLSLLPRPGHGSDGNHRANLGADRRRHSHAG